MVAAVPRKVYANAHAYHINSISINSDGETYMSADDLRVNLWNLNISDQSFSTSIYYPAKSLGSQSNPKRHVDILDIKPVNMEELTEVITAAEFHPISCNLFCYSSSKGTVKLADMRDSALCDKHAKREFAFVILTRTLDSSRLIIISLRGGGGSYQQVVLLGNHFVRVRREILQGWSLYSVEGLPYPQNLGYQYGIASSQNDQCARSSSREIM
jgi:WD40 repeat protein